MPQIRDAEEVDDDAAATTRRTIGAPRVQATPEAGTGRKPTAAEIEARQEAIRETRRPTKAVETTRRSMRGEASNSIAVPDVEASGCEEREE